jgi:nucleoside-diphosphate-sugar epimerase
MNNNILITGASGFIGNFLVDEAIKRGYNVFATIRKSTKINRLEEKKVNLIEIDFKDSNNIKNKLLNSPHFKYIIHNAGITKALKNKELSNTIKKCTFKKSYIDNRKIFH